MALHIDPNGRPQARTTSVLVAGGAAVVVGALAAGVLSGAEPRTTLGEMVATRPVWNAPDTQKKVLNGGVEKVTMGEMATTQPQWCAPPPATAPTTQSQEQLRSATLPRSPGRLLVPTTQWSQKPPATPPAK